MCIRDSRYILSPRIFHKLTVGSRQHGGYFKFIHQMAARCTFLDRLNGYRLLFLPENERYVKLVIIFFSAKYFKTIIQVSTRSVLLYRWTVIQQIFAEKNWAITYWQIFQTHSPDGSTTYICRPFNEHQSKQKQDHSESAYLRQDECCPNPDSAVSKSVSVLIIKDPATP